LFAPLRITVGCLTAATDHADTLRVALAAGDCSVVIGTHALFSDTVQFAKLGLVVVDEQHRFGVDQREALLHKAKTGRPHCLLMSATPIPRSLAQTLFGITAVSSIRSMPAGRLPIQTTLLKAAKRNALMARVIKQAQAGAQIYWVCPKINASASETVAATALFDALEQAAGDVPVALLHGRQSAEQKQATLEAFESGAVNILVSTVVVEVGVHVPDATIMVIDDAQCFGMAQLHQLRGRVGRSDQQAYCVLVVGAQATDEAGERLKLVSDCQDGFALAEADLAQRGPGDLLGLAQSGCPPWRLLAWPQHTAVLKQAQQYIAHNPLKERDKYLIRLLWSELAEAG
jgi:ATP-dependent DNA helicase RecG